MYSLVMGREHSDIGQKHSVGHYWMHGIATMGCFELSEALVAACSVGDQRDCKLFTWQPRRKSVKACEAPEHGARTGQQEVGVQHEQPRTVVEHRVRRAAVFVHLQ